MLSRHVIVVDDGDIQSLKLTPRLKNLGFDVIAVSDQSDESIAKLAKAEPEVAVLDFMHNAELGDNSTAARVEKVLNIPVLFVAQKSSSRGQSKVAPAEGYLLKPLDDLALKSSIEVALDTKRHSFNPPVIRPVGTNKKIVSLKASSIRKGVQEALAELRNIPPFESLPESSLRELAERSQFATVHAGDYIMFEGDRSERSFVLLSGRFAMAKTSVAGKELVVELLGPGDFFGLVLALEKLPAQLSARAQTDSEVLWIQTFALLKVMRDNPILYKGFAENLSLRLHLSHSISHGLAHDSVKVRIAALLLSLVAKFARVGRAPSAPVVIDITRQQIADLTGTTPESAIRMTREMQSEGLINVGSPGVVRIDDLEALAMLATM